MARSIETSCEGLESPRMRKNSRSMAWASSTVMTGRVVAHQVEASSSPSSSPKRVRVFPTSTASTNAERAGAFLD